MTSIDHLIAEEHQEVLQETFQEGAPEHPEAGHWHFLGEARELHQASQHLDIDPDFAPWAQG